MGKEGEGGGEGERGGGGGGVWDENHSFLYTVFNCLVSSFSNPNHRYFLDILYIIEFLFKNKKYVFITL